MGRIGAFELLEQIGEGHIATIYRAKDTRNDQMVALKVLRPDSPVPEAQTHFENEILVLAMLDHPRIPRLFEHGDSPQPYMAMTLIEGKDDETLLAELPQGSFLPVDRLIRWGIQICGALAHLHTHQPPIAFCDLKAAHLMIDSGGDAWLVDFNLAQILPLEGVITQNEPMGTEGFTAPEHHHGSVSPLVDVYGLGATLHYLSTRIDPRQERLFTYAPPRAINPALSKAFAGVIMKALAYEPEDRFESIDAMKTALAACL